MTTATTQPTPAGTRRKKYTERVGSIRPSQILHTYGVGSLVDLPNFSVIVAGLQSWTHVYEDIVESRLLAAVRAELGPQVERLAAMPWQEPTDNPFDEWARIGIPVLPFPRWFRCTKCDTLSTIDGDMFTLDMHPTRLDRVRYVHNCNAAGKPPLAVPARFVVACTKGHLDEFPWKEFAHGFAPCPEGGGILKLIEPGSGTRSTEVFVRCEACEKSNLVGKAFDSRNPMPQCRGRHPHLRAFEPCEEIAQTLLLGASNTWFGVIRSALALPEPTPTPLDEDVVAAWKYVDDPQITDEATLEQAIKYNPYLRRLKTFPIEDVWASIERKRNPQDEGASADLKHPEWGYFISPVSAPRNNEFTIDDVTVPHDFAGTIEQIVAATRLRETSALIGFARIEAPDSGLAEDADDPDIVPLTTGTPTWVPANDTRGEGIFIRLPEDRIQQWESAVADHERIRSLRLAIESDGKHQWPGVRYALLHSLSHLLIRARAGMRIQRRGAP